MKRPPGPSRQHRHAIRLRCVSGVLVSWYDPYRGHGPWRFSGTDGTQSLYVNGRLVTCEELVKKPEASVKPGLPSLTQRDLSACLSLFPNLNSLLSDPNWSDLSPKGKVCLMLFIDEATVRVLLKLEDMALKTSLAAHTIDDVLAVLEKALATDQVVWEQDVPRQHGGKKKGK
jgi:hypothetical protein